MSSGLASLLVTLVLAMSVGMLLRRMRRLHADAARTLNRLIVDVTLPALVIGVLSDAELDRSIGGALLATLAGQAIGFVGGVGVARLFGLPRATQGAAGLVAAFANTGFLGVPVAMTLYGGRGLGPSTAILIDSFNTTVLLWTSGLLFARRMADPAQTHGRPRSVLAALATPLSAAVLFGLVLHLAHLALPLVLRGALDRIGAATTALVFLSLGLSLDLGALRGRLAPLALVSAIKLVAAPLAALVAARALHLGGPVGAVAVLQSSMPTAMLAAILAAEAGCDGAFAAGVAMTTTLCATLSLPFVVRLLGIS